MLASSAARPVATGVPRDVAVAAAALTTASVAFVGLQFNTTYPLIALVLGLVVGTLVLVVDSAVWAVAALLIIELSIKFYVLVPSTSAAQAAATAASTWSGEATTGLTLRTILVLVAAGASPQLRRSDCDLALA